MPDREARPVVVLAGGVGGAKLAHGLQAHLGDGLSVVVNTADDTERHGLLVMPDHDTVMYTLAGLANREQGWGIEGETFAVAPMLERYGEETWFRLGDRDFATHIARSHRLDKGERLTDVCLHLQRSLGVSARILPVTDDPVRTEVRTDDGWLDFQEYFVRRHQEPEVREVRFQGAERAVATPEVLSAIGAASMVVVAPSNPIVSVGPILATAGVADALSGARARGAQVVAVSGIVGGKALKGPADRMLSSLGHESSALGVARIYAGWIDTFVIDQVDGALRPQIEALGLKVLVTDTIMSDDAARARLASEILDVDPA
jgi:LPPG:FO 2-phospho-L-lactate transferase